MAYYEETFGDFNLQALGVLFMFHPKDGWKLGAGAAVERKLSGGKDKALVRFLAGYDFHVGKASLGPLVSYDLIEDNSDVFFIGVALGFGF